MSKGRCDRCDALVMPGFKHHCIPVPEEPEETEAQADPAPAAAPIGPRPRPPLIPVLLILVAGVVFVPSFINLLRGKGLSDATVYVDNSLKEPAAVEVDGKMVGRVFPDFMEKYALERGKRKITLRDTKGGVLDEIEVDLQSSGPYIFNPGADQKYELRTISYTRYGLGGENWTRVFGHGRWHEVPERVDYEFERPPEKISGNSGDKKTWLKKLP